MVKKKRPQKKSGSGNKKNNKQKKEDDEEVVILPYNLEAEVNRLWLESQSTSAAAPTARTQPLGVQGLLDLLVAAHPDGPAPLKRQVRAAKNVIPYRYVRRGETQEETTRTTQALEDDADFGRFVQQTIEQRSNFKAIKRWEDVNELTERLQAMGVELDDNHKTWTIGTPVVKADDDDDDDEANNNNTTSDNNTNGVACQMCGRTFGSKNLIFKHLRDPTSSCGNAILGRGESLAEPPSAAKKNRHPAAKEVPSHQTSSSTPKRKRTPLTPQTGATTKHAPPPEACVWMGDLPLEWTKPSGGQYKHLKALLFRYSPRGVLPPRIKTVIRKGYRRSPPTTTAQPDQPPDPPPPNTSKEDSHRHGTTKNGNGTEGNGKIPNDQDPQQKGSYLGYAILYYRDAAEANLVMEHMKDLQVMTRTVYPMGDQQQSSQKITEHRLPNFVVKVRPSVATENKPHSADDASSTDSIAAGLDPPILKQLQPLPMEELQRRYVRLCGNGNGNKTNTTNTNLIKAWEEGPTNRERRDLVVDAYTKHYHPRREVRLEGKPISKDLQTRLLGILQTLRWPAENHRAGLSAERYLVLTTTSQSTAFDDLKQACRELMDWADAEYYYSGIAVTKNFVASPHIDDRDQSFQYAVALGDFTTGGELCVEGTTTEEESVSPSRDCQQQKEQQPPDFVNVVETRNRIARVDGRHVHWVRTWQGGDRYSLIFYDTSDRFPTPILPNGADLDYLK